MARLPASSGSVISAAAWSRRAAASIGSTSTSHLGSTSSSPSLPSARRPRVPSPTLPSHNRTFISDLLSKYRARKQAQKDAANPFKSSPGPAQRKKPILAQDDLFHVLAESPIPDMRKRAERIKRLAPCPVNLKKGKRVLVQYDCPECGWPTHYSEKEWREDEERGKYLHRLREANEDEHDLRSGREMTEFKLPGPQGFEEAINLSSWDVFFYTRNFPSIETERSRRHVSKLLTFPSTIAGVLHENSPYTTRNRRMTREGTRSFLALRQLLHPQLGDRQTLDSVRIFIVGARAESTLPTSVWDQLRFIFPNVHFHLYLIGPEVVLPNWNPLPLGPEDSRSPSGKSVEGNKEEAQARTALGDGRSSGRSYKSRPSTYGPKAPSKTFVISEGLTTTYIRCNYEEVHHQLEPFDPYTDVFFAFSPGFGFPSQRAYDRPRNEEEDEDGVEQKEEDVKVSSAKLGNTAPQQREALDRVAADIESQGEISEGASQSRRDGVPNASTTVSVDPETTSDDVNPIGTSYSTLPTLPPLLQAQSEWAKALTQMLSTKVPIIVTGFSPADVKRDVEAFETVQGIKNEFEWLITPGENVFSSLSWVIADFDPRVAVKSNWGIWAVRGKRYDLLGPDAYLDLNPFNEQLREDVEEEIEEEQRKIEQPQKQ
ncbi:unnamed protein product [Sympodiomycopsis kandeliae]